jgi:flagellar biosynthesis GTPase FlhF
MVRLRAPVTNRSNPKKKETKSTVNLAAAPEEVDHDEPDDNDSGSAYKEHESEPEDDDDQSQKASNSDNNDEDDEFKEADEENDESREAQVAIDAATAKWILSRINELEENEIGLYSKPTKFGAVCQQIEEIRTKNDSNDYFRIATDLQAWADSEDVMNVFSSFRGIIEFIIRLHRLYEVPLTATTEPTKAYVLLDTMQNAIRKFNNRFHNS